LDLALRYRHHLFDTLYHAVALHTPGAVLVTADERYYNKTRLEGQISVLADFGFP
jgi:predicted nucleic acid-binding protein